MDPHYVYAEQPFGDENTRVLKQGDTFAIFDHYGNIRPKGLGEQGLFHGGTRFLSYLTLSLNEHRPMMLSSTIVQDNSCLTIDLTNPDFTMEDGTVITRGSLHILRSIFIWDGTLYESTRISNYSRTPIDIRLKFRFESDFADIFEVRGSHREKRGEYFPQILSHGKTILRYQGLDAVERRTKINLTSGKGQIDNAQALFTVRLAPQEQAQCVLSIECEVGSEESLLLSFPEALQKAKNSLNESKRNTALVSTSNQPFNEWISRSEADLHMMLTETAYGNYPYAGVPWFSAPFGRDGIITALECLWFFPNMARNVLTFLAATQATDIDDKRDAQPGKILHEMRDGEMAALGEIPFGRYYGSVDSTPLFLLLAGAYFDRTGDLSLIRLLWPNLLKALEWIEKYGDRDGDGFVEYFRESKTGLVNQGWKDSGDSVFHDDGSLATGPIALCEVQGYVYAAKHHAAKLASVLGHTELSKRLSREAEALQTKFEQSFWCEDLHTYAIALDGKKRPCRVRTSNAGQVLFSGIASSERAGKVAATLLSESFFSGWGIRTVAVKEPCYNPMSYHNGSVWPHDNALIALGFSKYRIKHAALKVLDSLFQASLHVTLKRMPELFCGFDRRPGEGPTLYPVACSPQAWSAGSAFMLIEAALGLTVEAYPRKRVMLHHPAIPSVLSEIRLHQLQVGDSSVDILLRRHDEDIGVSVFNRTGDVEVIVVK